ncbi:MAG: PIG-L family deacetylase [Eubacterium sp.]|nr:PIG-L family deacetylase [Eubacterium sp.]
MNIQQNDRLLIVAPHPDDESIGCGGLLALYGPQCDVMLLTDGRLGKSEKRINCSDEEIISTRLNELKSALEICNVHELITLNIPDSQVKTHKKVIMNTDLSKYDYIFVPNIHESHPDHYWACKYFRRMCFFGKTNAKLYEYEDWTPLRSVDWLIDISSVEHKKEQMIKQHISQLECLDYFNSAMGLSHFRGIGCRTSSAEAFYRSPVTFIDILKRTASNTIRIIKK